MTTQNSCSISVEEIDNFIREQQNLCSDFVEHPEKFLIKMVRLMNEGKTHWDLAEELGIQEGLASLLVYVAQNNIKDLLLNVKEISAELVLVDFDKLDYKSFVKKSPTDEKGPRLSIYPKDSPNWNWDGDNFDVRYPSGDPDFSNIHWSCADEWSFYFRPPHKVYFDAKTKEDKEEVLQMIRLVNKWLWDLN